MQLANQTVLVTGGGSGIGFALAKRFAEAGSKVIVCGRRAAQLEQAKRDCPNLITFVCDVSKATDRTSLARHVMTEFPQLNVVVNNAGIQNRPGNYAQSQDWAPAEHEIAINLEAPIHLSMLFAPFLVKQPKATIINVTSGLAFTPLSFMPVYCATKAALHSFTLSLRHQLKNSSVTVVEVAPPAVNTDLGGKGLHDAGVPLDEFADHAMAMIAKGELEVGYGFSEKARLSSRDELNVLFQNMNK